MSQHWVRSLETRRNALMQKTQKSTYDYRKYENFVIKNIYCVHKHGQFQTFDGCSFPSNLTEATEEAEVGAPAAGSVTAE